MTRHLVRALAVAALAAIVASCQTGTVVLLPEKDGKDTAVVVKQKDGQVVLAEPYAAAKLTTAGSQAYKSNPQEVEALFGAALAAQPSRPIRFTVQFIEGKDEVTEDSKVALEAIFAEIAKRPVPDVLVVGHTDSVGSDQFNDALSRQRAEVIRTGLIKQWDRAREHPGRGTGETGVVGANRRRRGGAAQSAGRDSRALNDARPRRLSSAATDRCLPPRVSLRRRDRFHRNARIVRSSAGSAPAAKASTSARSASTTTRVVVCPRLNAGRIASTRALPYNAPARILAFGHAVGHRAQQLARSHRVLRALVAEIAHRT